MNNDIRVIYLPRASLLCFFCRTRGIGGVMIRKDTDLSIGICLCGDCADQLQDVLSDADGEEIQDADALENMRGALRGTRDG